MMRSINPPASYVCAKYEQVFDVKNELAGFDIYDKTGKVTLFHNRIVYNVHSGRLGGEGR